MLTNGLAKVVTSSISSTVIEDSLYLIRILICEDRKEKVANESRQSFK